MGFVSAGARPNVVRLLRRDSAADNHHRTKRSHCSREWIKSVGFCSAGLIHGPRHAKTARVRAQAVSDHLQAPGVSVSRIDLDTKVWRVDSQGPIALRNQIEVEFEPTCGPNG
jgi:hypothetical protein